MPRFLRDIRDELKEFPRNPNKYPRLRIKTVESRPQLYHNSLMYRGVVIGETANYVTSIRFFKIEFQKNKDEKHKIPIKTEGVMLYYKTPSVGRNEAQLKCSCFIGDTLIPLTSGKSVPIRSLVGKSEFFVYSYCNMQNRVVVGRGTNCEIKEQNAALVEVKLDNGSKTKCTPDHRFMLDSGAWIEAKDLVSGTVLKPFYRKTLTTQTRPNTFKVVSVTALVERQNVYCFTVDGYHNFAIDIEGGKPLSSGVIVHNCDDFRFRWEHPLFKESGLIGQFRKYTRKTPPPPVGAPYANEHQYLGYCKHVHSLLLALRDSGMLTS